MIFFTHILSDLSYMIWCVAHRPQGELCVLAQNCQLFTRLLYEICYKV